jgi:hypothetical protein
MPSVPFCMLCCTTERARSSGNTHQGGPRAANELSGARAGGCEEVSDRRPRGLARGHMREPGDLPCNTRRGAGVNSGHGRGLTRIGAWACPASIPVVVTICRPHGRSPIQRDPRRWRGRRDGKRQEGRLDRDRVRNPTTAAAVMTFPAKAVTFISRLMCGSPAQEPVTAPTSVSFPAQPARGGRLTNAVDPPGAGASAMGPDARGWREPTPGAASWTPGRCRARQGIWRPPPVAGLVHRLLQGRTWQRGARMIGARRGVFPRVIVEPSELVAALPAPGCGRGSLTAGADGVELFVRCRLCGHRGHAEKESAK